MPTYELALLLRHMNRSEMVSALKRIGSVIYERDGIIRSLQNLGTRKLAYKISAHGLVHRNGSHFTIKFDTPPSAIPDLKEELGRDVDVIRGQIFRKVPEADLECTISENLLPPTSRADVKNMIEVGQRVQKSKYNYRSGLDYYPFQK